MKDIGKKVLFSAFTLFLLFGLLEVGLRISGYGDMCVGKYDKNPIWACDPVLYFKLTPDLNINGGSLNKAGFRAHEFTPKPPGVYRVLTLGDSCTFGIVTTTFFEYIPTPYAQKLEQIVAERAGPGKVEVLNAGVPGYNSFQGVMLMRTKLRKLRPDLVTVRYGWNDHFMSRRIGGNAFREPSNAVLLAIQDLLLPTAIYSSLGRFQIELDARRQANVSSKATVAEIPREWEPTVPLDDYKHNLRRIAELARGRGAEVWFLTSPHAFVTDENRGQYDKFPNAASAKLLLSFNAIPTFDRLIEIHESYNDAARQVGAELGVPVVDMDAAYRAHASEHLFTSTDVPHPTQQGHDLEAEMLYAQLVKEGTIRPSTPPSVAVNGS